MSNSIREKLEEYFSSMNPTSSRMMADIRTFKQEYGNNWEELNPDEQSDLLWKSLVKPDAIKKYENISEEPINVEYFPVLRVRPGEKIIVEEDNVSTRSFGNSWRDEHSAPFRWETASQLGLDLGEAAGAKDCSETSEVEKGGVSEKSLAPEKNEEKKDEEVKRPIAVKRPEVPPPPVPPPSVPAPPIPSSPIPTPPVLAPHVAPHSSPPPSHVETPAAPSRVEKKDMPIYAKVVKRKSGNAKTLVISEMKAHRKQKEEMKPAVPPRMSLELKGSIDIKKYKTLPIDIDDIPKTGFDFLDNW